MTFLGPDLPLARAAIAIVAILASAAVHATDAPSRPLRGIAAHDKARWIEDTTHMPSPVSHLLEGSIDANGRTSVACRGVPNPSYHAWRKRLAADAGRAR